MLVCCLGSGGLHVYGCGSGGIHLLDYVMTSQQLQVFPLVKTKRAYSWNRWGQLSQISTSVLRVNDLLHLLA